VTKTLIEAKADLNAASTGGISGGITAVMEAAGGGHE